MLVFLRAPELGRVKTRLAASIGPHAALRIYQRLAEHTITEARGLAAEGVEVRVHHTPADARLAMKEWLGDGLTLLPQAEGDLGARMRDAFGRAFADGCAQVVIIGSDLPEMSGALLRRAFAALDGADAVIGPARDGGYYLLGLTHPVAGVFDGVAWSTAEVFDATMRRLRAAGFEPVVLETLRDVDEAQDLPPGWLPEAATDAPADNVR
ncbi:MAG TPA: TIGR04282 family arsenosugar biosynthesis glycosyltransferase [Longimicrobium sp.]|uniref:TIGR04282 family arsenosugar biosynthesis glycosyltransferase n=1 Tax=Longimicrobium sp. TaxID=2029185 RepID=UPI002ED9A0F7